MARFGRSQPIKRKLPKMLIAAAAPTGPTNLKTYNGAAKANVKTINGLAMASIKTFNGLT